MSSEQDYLLLLDENKKLNARVRQLSKEKANLLLIQHLLDSLNIDNNIENQLKNVLIGLGQCLGGTNIEMYYYADNQLNHIDLFGNSKVIKIIEDPFVTEIFESKRFIEKQSCNSNSFLIEAIQRNAWDWGFPLLINDHVLGAIKVSNAMGSVLLRDYLSPFFSHLALILNNQLISKSEEASNKAKSEFLATVSHEIRTPMNAILGMAELLNQAELPDQKRKEHAQIISNCGHHLLALLNDILDLSKIEAGKINLEPTAFNPHQLLDELKLLFTGQIHNKDLEIKIDCQIDKTQGFLADNNRLRQMLANLINNSIKFTPQGFIYITVKELKHDTQDSIVEFSVQDTGIGIATDKQSLLFKDFSQVDSHISRQYGGTGLGLSIVLQLTQLMHGDVGCESSLGEGARFWFRVPLTRIAVTAPVELSPSDNLPPTHKNTFPPLLLPKQQQQQTLLTIQKLDKLLEENMFDSINCYKELQRLLSQQDTLQQLPVLEDLINNMDFDNALVYLHNLEIDKSLEHQIKRHE